MYCGAAHLVESAASELPRDDSRSCASATAHVLSWTGNHRNRPTSVLVAQPLEISYDLASGSKTHHEFHLEDQSVAEADVSYFAPDVAGPAHNVSDVVWV